MADVTVDRPCLGDLNIEEIEAVTTSSRNFNINALRGGTGPDDDDMAFVERYGLDPALAYTPAINDAMLDVVMKQAIDGGMEYKQAMSNRMTAAADIKALMK